jgi:hypothetical protein
MQVAGNRAAAVIALTAILACSGLGLCWRVFDVAAHDCCEDADSLTASAQPCASAATGTSPATPTFPEPSLGPAATITPRHIVVEAVHGAFGSSFPVKSPPLVLRI